MAGGSDAASSALKDAAQHSNLTSTGQSSDGYRLRSLDVRSRLGENWDMTKGRLEAFSDGVIAIIITIMVL
jgi:hypothetical protein